jgi:hypothetical protein
MHLGKYLQCILVAVSLFYTASSVGQTAKNYKYHFDGVLHKSDAISDPQSIVINYSVSELNIEPVTNDHGIFYRLSIPGHTPSSAIGQPELPVSGRLIKIPDGFDYKVKISDVISTRIKPSGKKIKGLLLPAQEGETKSSSQRKPEFVMDKSAYSTRGLITSDTVEIQSLGIVRNNRLANLYISPARYNPHSNFIELITSMKIEITFIYTGISGTKSSLPESALFGESLDKSVLNYNKNEVITGYSDQTVKMVIVTDTSFKKHLEPFIRWKTQKGFKVKTLYRGINFAGNNYTQIKDTLSKIYLESSESDPPPEYLLIIGDVDKIPYYGTGNITDMYYGEFDGLGDYIPEMYIGRLPVSDTTQLKSVLSKIIQYEKFEFADTNYFHSQAIATAGYDAGYANTMNGQVRYSLSNYLIPENNVNGNAFFQYPSFNADSLAARKDSIINLINEGVSFINYTGHGDAYSWMHLDIKMDTSVFQNKNMYPFVVSNACQTSHFNYSNSLGNKMVVSADKGAIGFIGCSNDSYWDEDFYWSVGHGRISADPQYEETGLGAFDRLFHTNGESPSDWYITMGQVNYAGNMAVSSSTTSRKKYYWETYNLVGDPSVIPIIGKPDSFNIAIPDTLPNGIKSLSLSAYPFAYAAVSHFDSLWDASYVSASGSVTLDLPGISDDSCLVVISGQNKYPLIKTVYFSDIAGEYIHLTSGSVNDSIGNNNGAADFGESFYLKLTVSNLGTEDASNMYAKITSTSEWLTILSDSVKIGTLSAGSDIILSKELLINISKEAPDMEMASVNLMLKGDNSEKHYTVDFFIHAPQLNLLNCILDDSILGNGDFIADPGESFNLVFKISNTGSSDTEGDFEVSTPNSELDIISEDIKSGVLRFGEISEIHVTVKLSDAATPGSVISISSRLDCYPQIVERDFTFRIGKIRESFEAESFSVFPWINPSSNPWIIATENSYDGTVSARSGAVSHNEVTSLIIRTIFSSADSISFFYKVSSEINYDEFTFKINDTEVLKNSGEVPWTKFIYPVSEGVNKMEWVYEKDQSVSGGTDCAWIDNIDFAISSPVDYIRKDLQMARIVNPVQKDKYGIEPVTVRILNRGSDTINDFYLAYSINNQAQPVTEHFNNQVLPYGDSVTISFKTIPNLSRYGVYNIVAYGTANNDDYILNDTLKIKIENTTIRDSLMMFPNPFSDRFTIFYNSKSNDRIHISINTNTGSRLYQMEKEVMEGINEILIENIRLKPAIYYINIRGNTINRTIPLIKVNR